MIKSWLTKVKSIEIEEILMAVIMTEILKVVLIIKIIT